MEFISTNIKYYIKIYIFVYLLFSKSCLIKVMLFTCKLRYIK